MYARDPASFWREKVEAVVILLLVFAQMSWWRKQDIKFQKFLSFCDWESAYAPSLKIAMLFFLVKKGKMKLSGKSLFLEYAKKHQVKFCTRTRPPPWIYRSLTNSNTKNEYEGLVVKSTFLTPTTCIRAIILKKVTPIWWSGTSIQGTPWGL